MKKIFSLSFIALALLVGTTVNAQTKTANDKAMEKSHKEIEAKVDGLNKLLSRIGEIKRLSPAQKAPIENQIQVIIDNLNALKTRIDAGITTGSTTLKTDTEMLKKVYRFHALVMPQVHMIAAADRISSLTSALVTVGVKLQTRITEAETAGKNVASLRTTYANFTAKVTDANTQTQNALNLILPLVPDNDDKASFEANKKALKDAQTYLKKAIADIVGARKDAGTITKGLMTLQAK